MTAKYKELKPYIRQKIIKHIKLWLSQRQVAKIVWVEQMLVSRYLDYYHKQKVIDWRKYCYSCGSWKIYSEENFKWNSKYRKDWSLILRSTCKACESQRLKNEWIMNTEKAIRVRAQNNKRQNKRRAAWLVKVVPIKDLSPEWQKKRRSDRREASRKYYLKTKKLWKIDTHK